MNVPATSIGIGFPHSFALLPDGSVYFARQDHLLYRVGPSGNLTHVPFPIIDAQSGYIFAMSSAPNGDVYLCVVKGNGAFIYKMAGGTGAPQLIAGGGSSRADGPALATDIGWPYIQLAAANDGLYFTDGRSIRKVTSNGSVATLQTLLTEATETYIRIGVDASGNVYNHVGNRILKRQLDGSQVIVIGSGFDQTADGVPAAGAAIGNHISMTVDAPGNVYFLDNGRFRKIDAATGIVSTLAGAVGETSLPGPDGPVATLRYLFETQLQVDASGVLFFLHFDRVRKLVGQMVTTVAGGEPLGESGLARNAQMYSTGGPSVDSSGNIYVALPAYQRIRKISRDTGSIATVFKNHTNGFTLFTPRNVSIGPDNTLYWRDEGGIYKVVNGTSTRLAGGGDFSGKIETGMLATDLNLGVGAFAVAPNHDIYFVHGYLPGVFRIGANGRITALASTTAFHFAHMCFTPGGALLIGTQNGLWRYDTSAQTAILIGHGGIYGVSADPSGNIFFATYSNVQRIDALSGQTTLIAGYGAADEPADGSLAEAMRFREISGVAADHLGNVYVSDQTAHRVWRLTPRLEISTVSLPAAQVGVPYAASIDARYGTPPYFDWTGIAGAVPPGFSIHPGFGLLSGTPQTAGQYVFTVRVMDGAGVTATRQFTLVVREPWLVSATLTPQAGTGMVQEFTLTLTTAKGNPVKSASLFIGNSSANPGGSCAVQFVSGFFSSATPLSCMLEFTGNSAVTTPGVSVDTTVLKYLVRFMNAFTGTHKIFVSASGQDGSNSGSMERGSWTVGAPPPSEPSAIGISPLSGGGQTQVFTGTFAHSGSTSQLYLAYILLLPTPNIVQYTAAGSCLMEYNRISHAMRLINEAGDNWLGPLSGVPLAQGGTLSNSRCSLNIGASNAQVSGAQLIVSAAITLSPSVTGTLGTFLQGFDVNGKFTGMTQFGNWTAAPRITQQPGPYVVSVTPTNAVTSSALYSVTVGHTSGPTSLAMVNLRFNTGIVGGLPCHVVYFPASNTVNLINDADTGLAVATNVSLGSAPIGTGRCVLEAGASRTTSGNNLTLNLPMRFITPGFAGVKSVYTNVFDNFGNLTHWVQTGTLTVP